MLSNTTMSSWDIGETLEHLYKVQCVHEGGTVGTVYRVLHLKWNIQMALKRLKDRRLPDLASEEQFRKDCQTWVELGVHPNIVSCFYFRPVADDGKKIPCVFSEYVHGVSLSQILAQDRPNNLDTCLEIAIQLGWALEYIHSQDVIHGDVKPANVMVCRRDDGRFTAKLTDIGQGYYSPSFCSPEQAYLRFSEIGEKTDVWSFALTVLSMFWGRPRRMIRGVEANSLLAEFENTRPKTCDLPYLPPSLSSLLRDCFQNAPEQRPIMSNVNALMQEIYSREVGRDAPLEKPNPIELRADSLNNRALSLIDLGDHGSAVDCWERALQIDPSHFESNLNFGYWQWQSGRLDDLGLLLRLNSLGMASGQQNYYEDSIRAILLERGSTEVAAAKPIARRSSGSRKTAVTDHHRHFSLKGAPLSLNTSLRAIAWTPDDRFIVVGGDVSTLCLLDAQLLEVVRVYHTWQRKGQYSIDSLACVRSPGIFPHTDDYSILSGNTEGTLSAWAVFHREPIGKIPSLQTKRSADSHSASQISVSAESCTIAFASSRSGDAASVWSLATGTRVAVLRGSGYKTSSLCIFPGGDYLLSGGIGRDIDGHSRHLALWSIREGEQIARFDDQDTPPICLAVSPNGKRVLSGDGALIRLWDIDIPKNRVQCLRVFKGHVSAVLALSFAKNGRFAVSGGNDGTIRIWDVESGCCIRTLEGHEDAVTGLSLDSSESRIASCSIDKTVRIWSFDPIGVRAFSFSLSFPRSASELHGDQVSFRDLMNKADAVMSANNYSRAYQMLKQARQLTGFTGRREATDRIFRCAVQGSARRSGLSSKLLRGELKIRVAGGVGAVRVSSDGTRIAFGDRGGNVGTYDITKGIWGNCLQLHKGPVSSINWISGPSSYLVTSATCVSDARPADGEPIRLWSSLVSRKIGGYGQPGDSVHYVAFADSVPRAVVSISEHRLSTPDHFAVLEIDESITEIAIKAVKEGITSIDVDRNADVIACGLSDGSVALWRRDGTEYIQAERIPGVHKGHVTAVKLIANGRYLLTGGVDSKIVMTNTLSQDRFQRYDEHSDSVKALQLSMCGSIFVSGGEDRKGFLWDIDSDRPLASFDGHVAAVESVDICPLARFVVTGGRDGLIRVWEIVWNWHFS